MINSPPDVPTATGSLLELELELSDDELLTLDPVDERLDDPVPEDTDDDPVPEDTLLLLKLDPVDDALLLVACATACVINRSRNLNTTPVLLEELLTLEPVLDAVLLLLTLDPVEERLEEVDPVPDETLDEVLPVPDDVLLLLVSEDEEDPPASVTVKDQPSMLPGTMTTVPLDVGAADPLSNALKRRTVPKTIPVIAPNGKVMRLMRRSVRGDIQEEEKRIETAQGEFPGEALKTTQTHLTLRTD